MKGPPFNMNETLDGGKKAVAAMKGVREEVPLELESPTRYVGC